MFKDERQLVRASIIFHVSRHQEHLLLLLNLIKTQILKKKKSQFGNVCCGTLWISLSEHRNRVLK